MTVKITRSQLKELVRQSIEELKFGSKAQYDKYKKQHSIKPGTEIDIAGKKSKEKAPMKTSKAREKESDKFAADMNAKMDAAEKAADDDYAPDGGHFNASQAVDDLDGEVDEGGKGSGRKPEDHTGGPSYANVPKGAKTSKQAKAMKKKKKESVKKVREDKGDMDNDGKDEPDSEEYMDNKDKAIKKAMKNESKDVRCTVKEVKMWMRTLEENRYKKTYNSDARRVSWMVNHMGEGIENMPVSMSKKWSKAQYGRERYLAKEFIKSQKSKMNEIALRNKIRNKLLKLIK